MVRPVVTVVGCLLLAACTAGGGPAPAASGPAAPAGGTGSPAGGTGSPAGGTGSPAATASATAARRGVESALPCAGPIGTDLPPGDFQTVLGVVALPTSPRYPALQTSRTGGGDGPRLFAKTGLVVKAGTTFDLVVPDRTEASLGIGWGPAPTTPSRRLHIRDCPDAGGAGWLAYPGGYWIDRPACVALVVAAYGKQQQVRIGLGTPCPGQRPPQGDSDR